ncbi:GNAT family N-acetyltransferase [Gelidibacter mesophilus]|uniref:GNAT family N-acetyltransferase n=1 Tax=Gelidibacter mesophilus TaxID=169050 RepID=UPI00041054C2|nr:GNAT family N-acetyltransferase [Gelidibacter mesophilus]
MNITPSTFADINTIFELYDAATVYQKSVNNKSWSRFESALIEREISENRHFKIMEDDIMACSVVITLKDPVIGKGSAIDKAIYLHRIATHLNFRGRSYLKKIVEWCIAYGKQRQIEYIRMDTHSGNDGLNTHYIRSGFTYKRI